jgi:hypothetical protein
MVRGALPGVAGPVEARGGGSPGVPGEAGAAGPRGVAGAVPPGAELDVGRCHAGIELVGILSGGLPAPLPGLFVGAVAGVVGRRMGAEDDGPDSGGRAGPAALPGPPLAPGGGPGTGVRTGGFGFESNAGPGRGMGVSIGICAMGPVVAGGSSLNGSGVARGGMAADGGTWRRSSGSSRLRISGGGRVGSAPGSQAVQSPCGGNSAPHLRHLDTAA